MTPVESRDEHDHPTPVSKAMMSTHQSYVAYTGSEVRMDGDTTCLSSHLIYGILYCKGSTT